ncbi:TPA: hypothetical protein ACPVYZ_004247 [Vibrio parahaemolyticus]|uniref:hypothetical protein n=1 Tax=Vibrio parahaemolyticus TaxID=670 RepID=UPI00111C950F|nr:hypothetical protein [Vibrio parahaemolyticus]MBE4286402.1 hypothetical protein [Vibrio parahaemolyticus]TOH19158.1 hypothetical protein CGI90_04035 [Vibrio parahaemolyticus]HCG7330442.1 hypothetical protein [Vibrio parahaemolyticus]HCG9589021.1 hypothetical protein [Vibrio parahaemolyticus]HCM0798095.1 hypothetical protein [Vibrio parahaemolyticus]
MTHKTEEQILALQSGKQVKSIQHHEIIGSLEVHLVDGTSVNFHAEGKAIGSLMIIEPKDSTYRAPRYRVQKEDYTHGELALEIVSDYTESLSEAQQWRKEALDKANDNSESCAFKIVVED